MSSSDPINTRLSVESHYFDNARYFVSWLRPEAVHWGDGYQSQWLFRGQANGMWDLVPSAWRRNTAQLYRPILHRLVQKERLQMAVDDIAKAYLDENASPTGSVPRELATRAHLLTRTAELEAVRQFVILADQTGLYLPDTTDWVDHFASDHDLSGDGWFVTLSAEFHAFAQHHGIPTSLLDWTTQPINAAYFAAEQHQSQQADCGIAVWAVNLSMAKRFGFDVSTCRRHDHSFLHAQHGCFLYSHDDGFRGGAPFRFRSFTETTDQHTARQQEEKPFRRAVLNREQVPALMHIMLRERVTDASLRPSYDGVARTLKGLWDQGIGDWPGLQGLFTID